MPKVRAPLPPPSTPTSADPTVKYAGERAAMGYSSLVSGAGLGGLRRKARTSKTSLIGGP